MGFFNFNRTPKKTSDSSKGPDAFSTHLTDNDRDLSTPLIRNYYTGGNGMVYFGDDNLYPNAINELYQISGIHSACINFKRNTIVGGGYTFDVGTNPSLELQKKIKLFEIRTGLADLIDKVAVDFVKHGRAIILIKVIDGKPEKSIIIDPSKVRNETNSIFGEIKNYFISEDFERTGTGKLYTAYSEKNKDEWQVLELRSVDGKRETYPLPSYVGASNWIFLDGEMSYLHKQGIINSINPSMAITYPFETTPEEKTRISNQLRKKGKGARNFGRVFTFFGKNQDVVPKIEAFTPARLDTLYLQVGDAVEKNISMAHQMNPALAGVATAGKLGGNQELLMHYNLFEKNWGIKNRLIVEDFINALAKIWGINEKLNLNEYHLVDDEIKRTE